MELGIIGLGRMGANMARRLLRDGHRVVAYNRTPSRTREMEAEGVQGAYSLTELVTQLAPPRPIWIMVPAGDPVEQMIEQLLPLIEPGDILIDGGNSNYRDSIRRAERLRQRGVHFLDIGTSGGIWGLEIGYCLMVGGEQEAFEHVEPALKSLAPTGQMGKGYAHVGPSGAGHFVKMVHNGIEYGMMEALAEGFEILKAKEEFHLDLRQIAQLWQQGSVVRSWLLELTERALARDADLSGIRDWVADSGEGRWTVLESIDLDVPAPIITLALQTRFRSRQEASFAAKLLAALRREFGGHAVLACPGQGTL